jgi:hypothetical protein
VSGQQHNPAALYSWGKTRYPSYRRLGGPQGRSGRAENLAPTGIRSPDRPAHSQLLYRLGYPAHGRYCTVRQFWFSFPCINRIIRGKVSNAGYCCTLMYQLEYIFNFNFAVCVWLLMIFKTGEANATQSTTHRCTMGDNSSRVNSKFIFHIWMDIPYILESNPHPFYSFRGLKNQMRLTIACSLDS